MPIYARIEKGRVVELFDPPAVHARQPIAALFHPGLEWVDTSRYRRMPAVGWRFVNGAFLPPEAPDAAVHG